MCPSGLLRTYMKTTPNRVKQLSRSRDGESQRRHSAIQAPVSKKCEKSATQLGVAPYPLALAHNGMCEVVVLPLARVPGDAVLPALGVREATDDLRPLFIKRLPQLAHVDGWLGQ